MESRKEEAVLKYKNGCGCCQAILLTYSDLLKINDDILFSISEGLGTGLSRKFRTCGAVVGMVICGSVLNSSKDPQNPTTKGKTYNACSHLIDLFEEKNGTSICKELKGLDDGNVKRSCFDCIRDCCDIIEKELFNDEATK